MRAGFVALILFAVALGAALIFWSRMSFHGEKARSGGDEQELGAEALRPPLVTAPAVKNAEDVVWMLQGVSLQEAKEWAKRESLVVIDCREAKDFSAGHIPGARSLPEKTSAEWIADFIQKYERSAPLLIYCESEECPLAMDLSVLFFRHGFTNVKYLACGYDGWVDGGSPDLTGDKSK